MRARITQKEIARRLGVSQALVSRALTGTSAQIDASQATVARIRKAASGWNYQPSAAALTLKGHSSRTLGVAIKSFDDPFLGHVIDALQRLARREGFSLLLAGWDMFEQGEAGLELFRKYNLDGLVLCGSDCRPEAAEWFLREHKPVVQIGSGAAAPGVRQVVVDEERGLGALLDHLVGLGHRRIAFAGAASPAHARRESSLRKLLRQRGMEARSEWFVMVDPQRADGASAAVKRLLAQAGPRPTALMAADDAMAQTLLRALHEHGVRVPEDMSLTGLDDIPAAQMMIPALTTVRQPVEEMVRQAFCLATAAKTGRRPLARIVITPELVLRESCAQRQGSD